MKNILKLYFIGMIILSIPSFFVINDCGSEIKNLEQEKEATITGEIVAIDWDEEENVTAVAISVEIVPDDTTEEVYYEEYKVADNEIGMELIELVGKTVEATGIIETDEDENKMIYVKKYSVIE